MARPIKLLKSYARSEADAHAAGWPRPDVTWQVQLANLLAFVSDVAGNDLPMALVQEAESPRAQIGKYFLRVFLCGQLLPWDRVPEHPLLIFLRRLPCCHPHPPADIVRELEHGHMDGGGHGQSTGGATDSAYTYILVPLWDCKSK